jgi:hypothetical protein
VTIQGMPASGRYKRVGLILSGMGFDPPHLHHPPQPLTSNKETRPMNADRFRDVFYVLHNIDKSDLEGAGVIKPGAVGGSDWTRFNSDIGTFVLKLRQENLEALFDLVRSRLPAGFQ